MSAPARRAYLDYNATAPLRPCARDAMVRAMAEPMGNPASPHAEGRMAHGLLDDARQQVAALVGAPPSAVVFTSGGTEAVNAMLIGVVSVCATDAAPHVIGTASDHACVLECLARLGRQGCRITILPVDESGRLETAALHEALAGGASCVATHWANNETGVLQDIESVAEACRSAGVPLLLDGVQAAGKLPMDFRTCGASALALSGHKVGGPAGIGALILDPAASLEPFMRGGHQEHDRRAGTEAVLAAVGFGAAAAAAQVEEITYAEHVGPLRDALQRRVCEILPRAVIHGAGAPRIANTLNVRLPGWAGDTLVQRLDLEGIAAGTGAACAAGAAEPSHVLMAMGCSPTAAGESVRFSLGVATQATEIDRVIQVIARLVTEWGDGAAD